MEVESNPFRSMSKYELEMLLGEVSPVSSVFSNTIVKISELNAPESFDSRTQWPGCVHYIRD